MRIRSVLTASLAATLSLTSTTFAQVITSPTDPRLNGSSVIDFHSVPAGAYQYLSFPCGAGCGVTFWVFAPNREYVSSAYAGSYNTQGKSLQNTDAPDAFYQLRFSFLTPTSAFGFNWGGADVTWKLGAYDVFGNFIALVNAPITGASNAGDFIGIASSGPTISNGFIQEQGTSPDHPSTDNVFIDNFRYVPPGANVAPEPPSIALLFTGLIGAFALRRRQRRGMNA